MADEVKRAALSGHGIDLPGGAYIQVRDFPLAQLRFLSGDGEEHLRSDLDAVTGTCNSEAMVLGKRTAGALVFAVQSSQADSAIRYIFNAVDEAARKQLTRERAGLIVVGVEGLSPLQLEKLATESEQLGAAPTALRLGASRFLDRRGMGHVVGVGFLSRSELARVGNNEVVSDGKVYHFPNLGSRFWRDDFSGMFSSTN